MTLNVAHAATAYTAGHITWREYRHRVRLAAATWHTTNRKETAERATPNYCGVTLLETREANPPASPPLSTIGQG